MLHPVTDFEFMGQQWVEPRFIAAGRRSHEFCVLLAGAVSRRDFRSS